MGYKESIESANRQIKDLTKARNQVLRELRKECKHLRLAELDSSPPHRICVDCGAEERGWYCGYQILTLDDESNKKVGRGIVKTTSDRSTFWKLRIDGPMYPVGQSHPNFEKIGIYRNLTEQEPE